MTALPRRHDSSAAAGGSPPLTSNSGSCEGPSPNNTTQGTPAEPSAQGGTRATAAKRSRQGSTWATTAKRSRQCSTRGTAAKRSRQAAAAGSSSDKVPATVAAGEAAAAAAEVSRPPIVPDPRAGAFFDVDNTLMRGASIYHFARGLAARKMFGPGDLVRMALGQLIFRARGAEDANRIDAAREAALAFVAGHKVADIASLGEEIYDDTMADRIWEGSRELTKAHLDAGQRVWLVTATPVELAEILARRLGLTGALGTVAEIKDGVYTGRLTGGLLHGEVKAAAVQALAERENLDLARSSAYSDSINDLPMLNLVGHPNAVNPDGQLRALAKERNWPIHDFRKGRRATIIAIPVAAGAGALAGGVAAGIAVRRHRAAS